jgi:hypothetical protein
VDPRLHRVQGEAEGVKSTEQLALLQELYRDRLTLFHRHVEGARRVADYEFNNTYQYVIGREEIHLQWIRDAVQDLGGTVSTEVTKPLPVPNLGKGPDAERAIFDDDAKQMKAFIERWRARVSTVNNARHRKMLELLLGEMQEQTRFFEQAVAGRDDLLGRRMPGASTGDGVLGVRWME